MTGILKAFGALFFNTTGTDANSRSKRDDAAAVDADRPRGTILIIDDERAILDALQPVLCAEGFNVLTAQSSAKGLDMLRYCERDVRVVVLDYNMPRLNGADTLTYVRKLSPHVKVLALTGVEANLLPENFRNGADRFLAKPFSNGQLVSSVNELLGFNPPATPANS